LRLSIFFSCVVFFLDFGPFIFFSWSFAKCFSFYLFTYALVDFLILSMANPYKPYVQVVNLPQKSLQLLSYLVSRGLSSVGPILVKAHGFHKEFTQMGPYA
jgi:hypothetical protein